MPDWFRSYLSTIIASSSNFASLGFTTGGLLYFLALLRGWESPFSYFFAGACIAPGLLAFVYSTDHVFERRLRKLKSWHDDGLISTELYEHDVQQAMAWRAARLHGASARSGQPRKR